jgi:hypothetical protein
MSILVHDGKQKKIISTLLTIDLQISLQSSWLLFLDFKKILFNEIRTVVSMWKKLFKMVTHKFNHEWTT